MSKIVEIPGVGNVEFPDEMGDEDIGKAIQAHISSTPKQATTKGTENIPVSLMTNDPETDQRIAESARKAGFNEKITPRVVAGSAAIMAGLAAPEFLPGALGAAAGGGLIGAGASKAKDAAGVLKDAALSAGLTYAGGKVLGGIAKAPGWIASKAKAKVAEAVAKATAQATEEVAAPIQSAKGELGSAVQQGSRQVENLMRLEESMTPDQLAAYRKLQESGIVPDLQQRVAQSTLERLPQTANVISEKQAALEPLLKNAQEATAKRTADLLSKEEAGRQLKARLWRYGPPFLGSAVGSIAGGPVGTAVGFLAGAGSRPMVQSFRRMANTPAVQKALWESIQTGSEAIPGLASESSPGYAALLADALRRRRIAFDFSPVMAKEDQ